LDVYEIAAKTKIAVGGARKVLEKIRTRARCTRSAVSVPGGGRRWKYIINEEGKKRLKYLEERLEAVEKKGDVPS